MPEVSPRENRQSKGRDRQMGAVEISNEVTGRTSQIRIYLSVLAGSEQVGIFRNSFIGRRNSEYKGPEV